MRWGGRHSERSRPQRPAWPTFRRAVLMLLPHRGPVIGFLAVIAVSSLIGLAPPLLIRRLIDDAIPNGDGALVNLLVVLMLLTIAVGAIATMLQSYLSTTISQTLMLDLRRRLYAHLSGMSLSWFTANRTGDTLSRVSNDVGSIQGVVSDTLGSVLGNLVTLVSTFALMLLLDWRLAVFSVTFIPIFVYPAIRVGNIQRSLQRQAQEQLATLNSQMQETLSVSGALLVKTFGRQADEGRTFEETAQQIRSLSIRRAMVGRWFGMAMGLFGSVGPAIVYWYGAHRIIGGEASLGTVVALAGYLPRLFGPISSLATVNITVLSSLALFERIFDYLDLEQDIRDKPGAIELTHVRGEIEFRNVDFGYSKTQETLHDISFTVPAGRFAALVGPTGAGKTTIAYLVPRLYDVGAGQVLIDGHDVRDVTLDSLAGCIGMVNQEPFLFHTSIRENLRYARQDATDAEVEAAARTANIHDFIVNLPDGYDTVVGERGYRLSGGEKQRTAIARALLKDAAILILDEATSSVDMITEAAIQDALAHLTRGRTVLAIAHRLSTVLAADLILVVDAGRVVEQGTHAQLVAAGGHYARLYEQQLSRRTSMLDLDD